MHRVHRHLLAGTISMLAHLNDIVSLYNNRRYNDCMASLESVDLAAAQTPELLIHYHDLYGRVCYMLGLFDSAQSAIAKATALGAAERVEPLAQALRDITELVAKTPVPFNTGDWAHDKQVLRIGGGIPHAYQVHLQRAQRVFDTNGQIGYTETLDLLLDAHNMPMLKDAEFDVVCSSHTMEHLTNPLLALEEWRRVLRPSGLIFSVIPNRDKTFDHKRALTTIEHLIEDHHARRTEIDWHHVLDFLRNHDAERDVVYKGDKQAHFNHVMQAPQYNVHNHVFDRALVYVMHEYAGFKTLGCFEADIGIYYFGQKK
jgi:SAM-dependent methyltransferase